MNKDKTLGATPQRSPLQVPEAVPQLSRAVSIVRELIQAVEITGSVTIQSGQSLEAMRLLADECFVDPNACPECQGRGYVDQGEGCVSTVCECRRDLTRHGQR